MNSTLKYRVVAFVLAVVFGVFNIGIPVIIASCPMAAMMQGSKCTMCDDQDDPATSKVTTEKNTSCCATIVVAERNTTEFLQVKVTVQQSILQTELVAASSAVISNPSSVFTTSHISPSPPTVVDIPIFTSSLLI